MCVRGGGCSTTGPYVTYCVVGLSSYQCFRENQGSSLEQLQGDRMPGDMPKKQHLNWRHWSLVLNGKEVVKGYKQESRGKFLLQGEIINETMTKSQYWARDSVLILCQLTTLCTFRTDLVINLLQTCAM